MSEQQREQYTHGHHESVLRAHRWRTIANSAAYLEPYLRPGLSLLDVGSGPGTITAEFAERLAPGRVVGLDAAAGIVATASAEFERDNLRFMVGDAYALPFADAQFDIAHVHQTLQHVADAVAVLRELRRVVKPGGIVAAREVDYGGTFWFPASDGLDQWLALYQRVHRGNGGEPDAGRRLVAWAREAGFTDIRPSASVWNFADAQTRDWWGGAWADRVRFSAFAEDALGSGAATRDQLDRIAAAWVTWAADDVGWLAMPHGEIVAIV